MKAKVFFAALTRSPETGRDERVRSFLDFDFGDDVTANDVIEGVSANVKAMGGKTAVSRRSSRLLVFDPRTKGLSEVDRESALANDPTVRWSVSNRGSVGFLIDDRRAEKQFFRSHESSSVMAPHSQTAVPDSARGRSPTGGHAPVRREPSPAAVPVAIGTDVAATVAMALKAELEYLRERRATLAYPHWSELLPHSVTTHHWSHSIQAERAALQRHRLDILKEQAAVDADAAGIKAESARLSTDIAEMEAAALRSSKDFDVRASLERKLKDLREEVDEFAAEEAKLVEQIDKAYSRKSSAPEISRGPSVGRGTSSIAPATPVPTAVGGGDGGGAGGGIWPSFKPDAYGTTADQHSIAAMWGLGVSVEDFAPAENKPPAAASAASERPRRDDPQGGNARQPETSDEPLRARQPSVSSLRESPEARATVGPHLSDGGGGSLETGLSMLDPALNAEVRKILQLDHPASDVARSADVTRPARRAAPAALSSAIPLRMLASELSLYLGSDGSDQETRRRLLLRVQELRETISGAKSSAPFP